MGAGEEFVSAPFGIPPPFFDCGAASAVLGHHVSPWLFFFWGVGGVGGGRAADD